MSQQYDIANIRGKLNYLRICVFNMQGDENRLRVQAQIAILKELLQEYWEEQLRIGDTIEYLLPLFMQGKRRTSRQATIHELKNSGPIVTTYEKAVFAQVDWDDILKKI